MSWCHRLLLTVLLAVVTLGGAGGIDLAVLASRPQRVAVSMPAAATVAPTSPAASAGAAAPAPPGTSRSAGTEGAPQPTETWLLVGVDSRDTVPQGPDHYGTTQEVPGSRADVLALVQPTRDGLSVLTLPRDLVLIGQDGSMDRLATSYLSGPQGTVDLLCHALGVTTTHLAVLDMAQFASIVDSLGGLDVDVPEPVRDSYSGLSLTASGPQHLSGTEALALVRSRHPEVLREGAWTALDEAEGKQRRSEFTATVMGAALEATATQAHSPWGAHRLAHDLASQVTLDGGTRVADMLLLARSALSARTGAGGDDATSGSPGLEIVDVPAAEPTSGTAGAASSQGAGGAEEPTEAGQEGAGSTGVSSTPSITVLPDDETYAVLAEHGYAPGSCTTTSG